eukprot:6200414-Amphidinium_carterae.1
MHHWKSAYVDGLYNKRAQVVLEWIVLLRVGHGSTFEPAIKNLKAAQLPQSLINHLTHCALSWVLATRGCIPHLTI